MRTLAPPLSTGTCRVEIVTDHTEFLALEQAWNDTVDRAGVMHPFLRHEWVRTWWDAFGAGRQLHILIVRIDDRDRCDCAADARIGRHVRRSGPLHPADSQRSHAAHRLHRRVSIPRSRIAPSGTTFATTVTRGMSFNSISWRADQPTSAAFLQHAAADGCSTGVWKSSDSPYLTLTWHVGRLPERTLREIQVEPAQSTVESLHGSAR